MEPIEDARRDRVIAELRRHHASGRLDANTLQSRVDTALTTTNEYELDALLLDLPQLEAYSWSPMGGQQVAPFRPAATPGWQVTGPGRPGLRPPRLRSSYIAIALVLGLTLLMVTRGSFGFWMLFLIIPILNWSGRMPSCGRPAHPEQQAPATSGINDRFNSDGGQWPTRP